MDSMAAMEKLELDFFIQLLAIKQQWGAKLSCTRGGTKTISFPIAFSTCFTVIGQDNGSENGQDNSIVRSFSASSFLWYSGATTTMNFVAIGKQLQWGLYSSATTGNKSISFPISFKTIFAVVLTKGGTYGDSPSFQYLKADNVTTTKFETSTYSTIPTVRWIALGKA